MAKGRFSLSRRAVLRGLAGVAIGLPFLEAMSTNVARAAGPAKRLVIFFTPNGTIPSAWVEPGGTETSFTLGPILQPLKDHQKNLVVLTGIDNVSATHGPGDDHQKGMGTMLTGIELQDGTFKGGCDTCPPAGFAGGASVDQVIAQKVGTQTKLGSMEFGVAVHDSDDWSRMSYSGPGAPLPPIDDPALAYTRLFKDFNADPAGAKQLAAERHLVLDSVMPDAKKLKARLGAADRIKLDQHLDALDGINKHLDQVPVIGGDCSLPPPVGALGDIYDNANYQAIGKLQMDLLVMGLACDVTRVSSLQWTRSVGDPVFSWLNVAEGHHSLSHHPADDPQAKADLVAINTWYAQQFAYLLDRMTAIHEGNGTLLDNSVVLWCNELGIGHVHSHDDMRFLLAGGCGGALQTGRHLDYKGDSHNDLLVSLCQMMDVPISSFGNPAYCSGALSGLLA